MAVKGQGKDFFISYTNVDQSWAEWIAVELERSGWSTELQAWDFRPGSDFLHKMHKAASSAARTIAVLSPAYLRSAFTEAEWRVAFHKDPSGELGLLLPVRVASFKPSGFFATRVYIDFVGLDEGSARRVLLDAVDKNWIRPTRADFPGETRPMVEREPGVRSWFPGTSPLTSRRSLDTGESASPNVQHPSGSVPKSPVVTTRLNWTAYSSIAVAVLTLIGLVADLMGITSFLAGNTPDKGGIPPAGLTSSSPSSSTTVPSPTGVLATSASPSRTTAGGASKSPKAVQGPVSGRATETAVRKISGCDPGSGSDAVERYVAPDPASFANRGSPVTVRFVFRSCYANARMDIFARSNHGTWHKGPVVSDADGVARFNLVWRPKSLIGSSNNPDDIAGTYFVTVDYSSGRDGAAFNVDVTNDEQTPPMSEWSD